MNKYTVIRKVYLVHHDIEANSAREAENIARELGGYHAGIEYKSDWHARKVIFDKPIEIKEVYNELD